MAVDFVERLRSAQMGGDLTAAWELLHGLEGESLAYAKTWFATAHRTWDADELVYRGATSDERFENERSARYIRAMCAVRLCGPVTAAKRVPWRDMWDFIRNDGEAALVQILWDQDPAWVAGFAQAASEVNLGTDARHCNESLARIVRAAVVHHDLPCPSGRTFLAAFPAGIGPADQLDWLGDDPLFPDVLLHLLDSGHCGSFTDLPRVVGSLTSDGRLDRGVVVAKVLDLLTAPQRPNSQRVLADVLDAVGLRSEEVPGGLPYLLGVMSASVAAVSKVLLPRALELVESGHELLDLTQMIGARSAKQQKVTLLVGIRALVPRLGTDEVRESLRFLADDADAAYAHRVQRLLAQVSPSGVASAERGPGPAATGLWEKPPTPRTPVATCYRCGTIHPAAGEAVRWLDHVDDPALDPEIIDAFLRSMVDGSFGVGDRLIAKIDADLRLGRLRLGRVIRVLESVFLAGGLRQGWPAVVAVAETCCAAPRRPRELERLLRLLSSFAAEVPGSAGLGPVPHIASLAASHGRSKAQSEARRLLERLPVEAAAAPDVRRMRGLWTRREPSDLLPSDRRLQPMTLDPTALRSELEADFNAGSQSHVDTGFWSLDTHSELAPATVLTHPDRLLAATVRCIHAHGEDAVREALRGIERAYEPVHVVGAIDLWVSGGLDVAAFWRVARARRSVRSLRRELMADPHVRRHDVHARLETVPHLAEGLAGPAVSELVLPESLSSRLSRLAFLRAAEALLLAPHHEVVLSEPTYADGTLDLHELDDRLARATDGGIGPLDMLQALHRLRPVGREGGVSRPRGVHARRTRPDLTSSEGGTSWDAVSVRDEWLDRGGLPQLAPVAVDGLWTTETRPPIPWSLSGAAPSELGSDPFRSDESWQLNDLVRTFPRWVDCTVPRAFAPPGLGEFEPRLLAGRAAGPLGVPMHDRILQAIATDNDSYGRPVALPLLEELVRHDRLVPAAAAAAAVGRHEAGTLALGRLVRSVQYHFEQGLLSGLWDTVVAVAEALCGVSARPSALPALLKVLTTYAHEVPAPVVPRGIVALAADRGSSRSHVEARALVAAVRDLRP